MFHRKMPASASKSGIVMVKLSVSTFRPVWIKGFSKEFWINMFQRKGISGYRYCILSVFF